MEGNHDVTFRNRSAAEIAFRRGAWFWFALTLWMVLASGASEASEAGVGDAAPNVQEASETDPWESFNTKMFWFNKEVLD